VVVIVIVIVQGFFYVFIAVSQILVEILLAHVIIHQFTDDRFILVSKFRLELFAALIAAEDVFAEVDAFAFYLRSALSANTEIH